MAVKSLTYKLTNIQRKQKKTAEEERFSNIINRDDSRKEVFKIAKQMKAEDCDAVGDKCVKNEGGELVLRNTWRGEIIMKDSLMKSSYGITKIWS